MIQTMGKPTLSLGVLVVRLSTIPLGGITRARDPRSNLVALIVFLGSRVRGRVSQEGRNLNPARCVGWGEPSCPSSINELQQGAAGNHHSTRVAVVPHDQSVVGTDDLGVEELQGVRSWGELIFRVVVRCGLVSDTLRGTLGPYGDSSIADAIFC